MTRLLEREGSSKICYHSKFGRHAKRCRSPCRYGKKSGKLKPAVAVLAANKPTAIRQSRLFVFDKNTSLKFLVDSGSDVSCLPVPEMFKKLSPEPLQLFAANNSKILSYGSKLLNIDLGLRRNFSWKFLIASVPIPIIGADFLDFWLT
ncbi:peptidase A2 domain-containing protein [Trichonephila clavata]|uniref:Peptidase A2 domain-containing protein n=1 Tax=Trichonephila clavata TaxID=2740835 RepID=A0A8X6G9R1_TRICU|nr:peptidase A2 domain-containing protein [Trichonephila clavata]